MNIYIVNGRLKPVEGTVRLGRQFDGGGNFVPLGWGWKIKLYETGWYKCKQQKGYETRDVLKSYCFI